MDDSSWMREALAEASKGVGLTSPNPPVGAIVVKDGHELGRGWHRAAGEPHAEREAINQAKREHGPGSLVGGTLYVTLEPCSTRGRTGACTDALIAEGLHRVVYGAEDPNPAHAGRATAILETNRIQVTSGVEQQSCQELIRAFAKVQQTGLPWLMVKTAMSLDGRITRPPGEGVWLTSEESRTDVQRLRTEVDAILTTGKTIRSDNARLTLRGPEKPIGKEQPWRVIMSSHLEGIPAEAAVLTDEHASKTLIRAGVTIETVLRELVLNQEVNSILVEAGGRFVGALLDEGWADELVVYLAPLVTSGVIPAVGGEGVASLAERWRLEGVSYQQIGSDLRLRGRFSGQGGKLER